MTDVRTSPATVDGVQLRPRTIADLPFFAAGRFPKPDLIGRAVGGRVDRMSGRELVDAIRDFGLGLAALGVGPGDRVAILSESRPEWLLADFAVVAGGAVTTPIYPTLAAEQVRFILEDSGATVAVVSTAEQQRKLEAAIRRSPATSLRAVVAIEAPVEPALAEVPVVPFAEVSARGHRRILDGWGVGREFRERAAAVRPDDLATIIYTSGTTGDPKGVMLTHGNLVANVSGVLDVLDLGPEDVALSFLPLCHAFERIVSYVYFASGVSMIFAESIDTVARDLAAVRPTVMTGVPRVFEKLRDRVVARGREGHAASRLIFQWALGVADRKGRRAGSAGYPWPLAIEARVAERLVFGRVRAAVGGRLRYAVSGSAPLAPDVARFFYGLGVPVLEGYGLTETAPVLTVMPRGRERFGTVGPPLPNVELRLADDGEVLARGPNVMAGYFNRPAETAAVLDGGWFHTGDIGAFDEAGYLRITDRKKDFVLTSGGKKIAPQPIEDALRADPLVSEALVVGNGRKFPAAVIVPDFAALAARLGVDRAGARDAASRAEVAALFQPAVDRANAPLAQFERIKKFVVLAHEFSIDSGELTPTLKVKRRVVEEKFRAEIEQLYQ